MTHALEYALERVRRLVALEREQLGGEPPEFSAARRRANALHRLAQKARWDASGVTHPVASIAAASRRREVLETLTTIGVLLAGVDVGTRTPTPRRGTTAPREIACPRCGAVSGRACYTPAGHRVHDHAERRRAAIKETP